MIQEHVRFTVSPDAPLAPGRRERVIWRLGFAVAALTLVAGAAVLVATGRESETPPLSAEQLSAEGLVDSIGVVLHFTYVDTAYARRDELVLRLRELGVKHIREGMPTPSGPLASGLRAARREGIRATLLADPAQEPGSAISDSVSVMGDAIDAFEGPNEIDNSGDPAWSAKLPAYMRALEGAARRYAPGVTLIGPSFIESTSRSQVPADLPGLANGHPYPGGEPPEPTVDHALRDLRAQARERPLVFTETGYHNALRATTGHPPTSEEAAAIYLPRMLLTAFGAGAQRTFIYELVDEKPDPALADPEQHFGLLRNDLSPKPAFAAIQTLIAALRTSPGPSSRGHASWRLRVAGRGEVERLTLARRDGSRVIALWRPVSVWDRDARRPVEVSPLPIELSFGLAAARDVAVWRPSVSSRPVVRRDYARRLSLDLTGDLVLVSLR
jgi:hypothetical protein